MDIKYYNLFMVILRYVVFKYQITNDRVQNIYMCKNNQYKDFDFR